MCFVDRNLISVTYERERTGKLLQRVDYIDKRAMNLNKMGNKKVV